ATAGGDVPASRSDSARPSPQGRQTGPGTAPAVRGAGAGTAHGGGGRTVSGGAVRSRRRGRGAIGAPGARQGAASADRWPSALSRHSSRHPDPRGGRSRRESGGDGGSRGGGAGRGPETTASDPPP